MLGNSRHLLKVRKLVFCSLNVTTRRTLTPVCCWQNVQCVLGLNWCKPRPHTHSHLLPPTRLWCITNLTAATLTGSFAASNSATNSPSAVWLSLAFSSAGGDTCFPFVAYRSMFIFLKGSYWKKYWFGINPTSNMLTLNLAEFCVRETLNSSSVNNQRLPLLIFKVQKLTAFVGNCCRHLFLSF